MRCLHEPSSPLYFRPMTTASAAPLASGNGMVSPHPLLPRYYKFQDQKRAFVDQVFNAAAPDYDRLEWLMAWGTGRRYRHDALLRAGLKRGMKVIDVAVGTGLLAREASAITGNAGQVIGLDPSAGMLAQAVGSLCIPLVRARAEELPFAPDSFDFLSMGFALRHVTDLATLFRQAFSVVKPGGSVCFLEITLPKSRIVQTLMRFYVRCAVPFAFRMLPRDAHLSPAPRRQDFGRVLWEYYWETIQACVEPALVLRELAAAGFERVRRSVEFGIFSEYTAAKPNPLSQLTPESPA